METWNEAKDVDVEVAEIGVSIMFEIEKVNVIQNYDVKSVRIRRFE